MPLFHFHFFDGSTLSRDQTGIAFASAEEAYLQVIATIRGMWSELLADGKDPARCAFEITTADDEAIFQIPFFEAVYPHARQREPSRSISLRRTFGQTHERATSTLIELHSGFGRAHDQLMEAQALLAKLDNFSQMRRMQM